MGILDNTATGAILGIATAKYNDERQKRQQQELTNIQTKAQKELGNFNKENAMDIWHRTNYEAQRKELEKAGLNAGLMYGQSGGGGVTTAGGSAGNVTGGNAPSGGGEIGMGIQQRMQLELLQAQKENIQADTKDKLANLPVKGAQTPNIEANTANTEAKTTAQEIENKFQKWKNDDEQGMGQSQAKRELLLTLNKTQADLRNMEQEFKNMGVDFNNIEASTNRIKSETTLKEQLKNYLENANPVTLALLRTASKMSDKQLERFQNDPNNTKLGMQVNYGMDKVKDIVDMGTDIYGAKTFRQLIEKEPQEHKTIIEETTDHGNGTTTNKYRKEYRK